MSATCSACSQENAGGKFCSECGAALPCVCPQCGSPVVSGRFCSDCGAPLSPTGKPAAAGASPAAVQEAEGERKQLTVARHCGGYRAIGASGHAQRLTAELRD